MKKNSLNTAVLASLAGIAGIANISSAVNINSDGTGQVLIYPYYTVNAGNLTLLSVVNTTNQGKAVKVRFLEGRNSLEVLDFNLYLSREDVWTAAVLASSATSAAGILTFDNSCTAPQLYTSRTAPRVAQPFLQTLYQNDLAALRGVERTREGHFELIEMGVIKANSDLNDDIEHLDDDFPPAGGCQRNFLRATSNTAILADMTVPTGGLFGGAAVLNIANGTYINYSATALDGFWSPAANPAGNFHSKPDDVFPSLTSVGSAITNIAGGTNETPVSLVFSNGQIIRSAWGTGSGTGGINGTPSRVDAVSALFMNDSLLNEYTTETGNNNASEWVITFPTKRYYVNNGVTAGQPNAAFPPFTNPYFGGQACESLQFISWNREELTAINDCTTNPTASGCGFSPPSPGAPPSALCFETNVLSFNQNITNEANGTSSPSKILGSRLTRNINTPSIGASAANPSTATSAGWLRIGMDIDLAAGNALRQTRPSVAVPALNIVGGQRFVGLPSIGFWAVSIENNNATPGVKGFYGGAYDHKHGRRCTIAQGSCFTP